jgi:hypothetical protein
MILQSSAEKRRP